MAFIWQYLPNIPLALKRMYDVLKPDGKAEACLSSTNFGFELDNASHTPKYKTDVGKRYLEELEREIKNRLDVSVICEHLIAHQYNTYATIEAKATLVCFLLEKIETKSWLYEKEVVVRNLFKVEPRTVLFRDPGIAQPIARGDIQDAVLEEIIDTAIARTLASSTYEQHEGPIAELWGTVLLRKPF